MSHIVSIKTEIRDAVALGSACDRLKLDPPVYKTARLFGAEATGHCVRLPEWKYPVVCDLENGSLAYDNFEGRWGNPRELDRLIQSYAVEKTKLEARRAGHSVTERVLESGAVKLTVNVGGSV